MVFFADFTFSVFSRNLKKNHQKEKNIQRARFTLHRRRPPPVYICCLHSVHMVLKRSDRASRAKNQEIQRGTAAVIESHGVETQ
jgi:hypothetical protein